jgi:hypothetical protein
MKQTAVEWLENQIKTSKYSYKVIEDIQSRSTIEQSNIFEQAKEMEKNQSYTYDELRTIAYNAYCLGQLDEPTEGKYNLWIQQFKKK